MSAPTPAEVAARLTPKERAVVLRMFTHEMHDTQGPDSPIWADCIDPVPGVPRTSVPGVVSSLNRKGLMVSSGDGGDACACLTTWGVAVAREIGGRDA